MPSRTWSAIAAVPVAAALVAACGGDGDPSPTVDAPRSLDARPRPELPIASCTPRAGTTVTVTEVTTVDDVPTLLTSAPGADPRLFILELGGAIRIYQDGALLPTPFLDLADNAGGPVVAGGEQGLLGLAFHPDYAANGKLYVYYTTADANVVAEYRVRADDPNRADPDTARVVLSIDDFAANHNGGMIEFGPDWNLYIGTGDGGDAGDPQENGQDPDALLAKMLRIDVDHPSGGRGYGIPPDNPFVVGGGAPEVYMTGLRNPWRWTFDRATDDLYIGDVGQGIVEEIDVVSLADAPGTDWGWDDCEGTRDYEGTACDAVAGRRRAPAFEQIRPAGGGTSDFTAIIGGQVYRSVCFPDLVGRYFFTDNGAGGLWSFRWNGDTATDVIEHPGEFPANPTFIHADAFGELYLGAGNGDVVRIEVE